MLFEYNFTIIFLPAMGTATMQPHEYLSKYYFIIPH